MANSRPTRITSNADQPASIAPVRSGDTQLPRAGDAPVHRAPVRPAKPARSAKSASSAMKPAKPRPSVKNSPNSKGSRRTSASTGPTRAAGTTGPTRTSPSASQGSAGGSSTLRPAGQPRLGWVKPFSLRLMILGLLVLLTFALLIPTVMRYLEQQQQLSSMRQQVATAQEENQDLSAELSRWKDNNYVIAQARERLSFVFPGETAYKVIDPESVVDTTNPSTGKVVTDGAVKFPIGKAQTWYGTLWDSVKVAGSVEVDAGAPSAKK